jgi:hypothetical protein
MTPVHQVGHMGQERPTRAITLHLDARLADALDEHIVNREHDGELAAGTPLDHERNAIVSLALRYYIDHWPDVGPYAPQTADATGASRRSGPAASEGSTS